MNFTKRMCAPRAQVIAENGLDARDTAAGGLGREPLREPRPGRRACSAKAGRNDPSGPRGRTQMTKGDDGCPQRTEPEESNAKSGTDQSGYSADECRRHH